MKRKTHPVVHAFNCFSAVNTALMGVLAYQLAPTREAVLDALRGTSRVEELKVLEKNKHAVKPVSDLPPAQVLPGVVKNKKREPASVEVTYQRSTKYKLPKVMVEAFQRVAVLCGGSEVVITSGHRDKRIKGPDGHIPMHSLHMQTVKDEGVEQAAAGDVVIRGCDVEQQARAAVEVWKKTPELGGLVCYEPPLQKNVAHVHFDMKNGREALNAQFMEEFDEKRRKGLLKDKDAKPLVIPTRVSKGCGGFMPIYDEPTK